jgi:agmatinase
MDSKPELAALFGAAELNTFFGIKKCQSLDKIDAKIVLMGAPGATPYRSVGAYCKNAPNTLRKSISSLSANIDRHNFDLGGPTFPDGINILTDCGDLAYDEQDYEKNRKVIKDSIRKVINQDAIPVLVGGDDSVPIPMLQAFENKGRYTILQIDAHIDWRNSHMDESLGLSSTMRRASEMPHIERIIQVGARNIGSGHSDDLKDALDWGVQFFSAYDLHEKGVSKVIELIPKDTKVIVCLDVDALDPAIVPGVIGRAPGGLSYFQTLDLIKGASIKGKISAINFVEFLPEADIDGIGAMTVSRLIASTLGLLARQVNK